MLSSAVNGRYQRLAEIAWWDQSKLSEARVLVAGAGALGNEIVKNLALLGVGYIAIADFDRVEMSNLSRSVLFRASDLGQPKAVVAATRAREINDDIRTFPLNTNIVHDLGLGFFRRVDVVLAGLDSVGARIALSRACRRAGKTWIDGALHELDGLVRVFHPREGACYECGLTNSDYAQENRKHGCQLLPLGMAGTAVPTSPTSASVIGALQVQEALKLLHEIPGLQSECASFSGATFEMRRMWLAPRTTCIGHDPPIQSVTATSASSGMQAGALLTLLEGLTGGEVTVELRFDLVESLVCPGCRTVTPVGLPVHRMLYTDARCDRCGVQRTARLRHVLDRRWPRPEVELSAIGIPPLEVLTVRTADGKRRYMELTADKCQACWREFLREGPHDAN